ncbi:MAG: hypothetical protein WC728_00325 [Elusimicrobiota bacterium]
MRRLPFLCALAFAASGCAGSHGLAGEACGGKVHERRSAELASIYDADQADRADFTKMTLAAMLKMSRRDERRIRRVAEIFAEGCLKTGKDYYHAAMVFQHGRSPDHFLQTYLWSSQAVALGDDRGNWLRAAGVDRYLMNTGRKQLYATQAQGMGPGTDTCYCLWPLEETATDEDRKAIGARTLEEQWAWIDGMNKGKDCGRKFCPREAKPTPKGSLPGVNW